MIAIWTALPLVLQMVLLGCLGAAAGALANCVIFACSNHASLLSPWVSAEGGKKQKSRDWGDRVPILGWLRLRRESGSWLAPLCLEVVLLLFVPLVYWCEIKHGGLFSLLAATWNRIALELRYGLLAVIGLCCGSFANYLIYTQAHGPRPISPWAPPGDTAPARKPFDRLPAVGWIGLARESNLHGGLFWLRPLLLELALAVCFPALYWFESQNGGLLPPNAVAAMMVNLQTQTFFSHAILLVLMVAATFIDFDEKTIPDIITIPGTVIALLIGTLTIWQFMPTALPVGGVPMGVQPTTYDSPWYLPPPRKWFGPAGLWAAIGIWTVWCFALADRRFSGVMLRRRGVAKTTEFFFAALFHHWTWKLLVAMWIAGAAFLVTIHSIGGNHWLGLFSSLVGLAVGGGTIWAIRLVASWAMQREAMGFGDVTLMAMIGAFIGWQGAVLSFGFSPFTAIFIVLIQYVLTRDTHVPFGPYLCAGTTLTVIFWDSVWNNWLAFNLFTLWDMLKWLGPVMLGLMGVMLFISRVVKSLLYRDA